MNTVNNPKYQQIKETAWQLFRTFGIKKVSVEEICGNSGVSKMTFYKFFQNKIDLAETLLNDDFKKYFREFDDMMKTDRSFPEKIKWIIQWKLEGLRDYGDFLLHDLLEIEDLKNFLIKARSDSKKKSLALLKQGKKSGALRKDLKPELFLYMIDKLMEMSDDPGLDEIFPDIQKKIHELNKFFFYGLTDPEGGNNET